MNKEESIKAKKPHVDKIVNYLKSKGIQFLPTDGELENVQFIKDDDVCKICYDCFYGFSGIAVIRKEIKGGKKNEVELTTFTDEMHMERMKFLIQHYFGIENE